MGVNPLTRFANLDPQREIEEMAALIDQGEGGGGAQDIDTVVMFDDFFGGNADAPNAGLWTPQTTKGSTVQTTSLAKGSGWVRLALPSADADHYALLAGSNPKTWWPQNLTFETRIAYTDDGPATEHFIGWDDEVRAAFVIHSGGVLLCGSDFAETGVTLDAHTAYKLKIEIDETGLVKYFVGEDRVCPGLLFTVEDWLIPHIKAHKNGGDQADRLYADYVRITQEARLDFTT